jgi:Fic family protein
MNQSTGYKSFVPKKLPPDPPLKMDEEMIALLSTADRKLGRLDGITQVLPNPQLFVAMYVKKEALLSSQIEGTQASLIDVLNTDQESVNQKSDVSEVVNYVKAMNYGLHRLKEFPLSLRLIKEIHAILLEEGRGSLKSPGEFRRTQNWIGPSGCTLTTATFVPPTVIDMEQSLNDLELFFYDESYIPALIKIALIHAQFETIHPFLDGNGRMGRLLITFWLCQQNILSEPLLYLSYFFKQNRIEYYDRLMEVRKKGDWEGWIKFFLRGIAEVSEESTTSAKQIISLKERFSKILYDKNSNNSNYQRLLDSLFLDPIVSKNRVLELLDVSYPTASSVVDEFCDLKILQDATPLQNRNKKYIFMDYLNILDKGTEINTSDE